MINILALYSTAQMLRKANIRRSTCICGLYQVSHWIGSQLALPRRVVLSFLSCLLLEWLLESKSLSNFPMTGKPALFFSFPYRLCARPHQQAADTAVLLHFSLTLARQSQSCGNGQEVYCFKSFQKSWQFERSCHPEASTPAIKHGRH